MNTTCSTITSWDIRQQFGDWMSPKKKKWGVCSNDAAVVCRNRIYIRYMIYDITCGYIYIYSINHTGCVMVKDLGKIPIGFMRKLNGLMKCFPACCPSRADNKLQHILKTSRHVQAHTGFLPRRRNVTSLFSRI